MPIPEAFSRGDFGYIVCHALGKQLSEQQIAEVQYYANDLKYPRGSLVYYHTPGFKGQSRVHLIHAPKKTTYIITECIEIMSQYNQSTYYIAEDLQNKR